MSFQKLNISDTSKKVAFIGIMSALGLVFGYFESLLPPIAFLPPGAKLGLGNILTMLTGGLTGVAGAVFVSCVKAGFALLTRGVTAGLMSLVGGVLSCIATTLMLRHGRFFGCVGIGMTGGILHNMGQLIVAIFLTSPAAIAYFPALILFGCAAGSITGVALYYLLGAVGRISLDGN